MKPAFPNLPCPARSPRYRHWPLRLLAGLTCVLILILFRDQVSQ